MATFPDLPIRSAHSSFGSGRSLLRWIGTSNPFYVLSAGLFLAGLWISFGSQSEEVQTWALMSGLGGYTLLLACTACLLVRFGNVWDDVRTVLLLVVLMFLATSVTFDEVLVFDPVRGFVCYLAGLLFAIGVSEGLLHGIRLALPAGFRVPYHLILSLFFLYPLALRPFLADPHDETLLWGLFAFSSIAGLCFLTLLPAIRRGPDYVRANGSPWTWPLYPWVLFGLLAFAVPARAFLLCWSMQLLQSGESHRLLFGPFFVVPFGLALAILLLEIGIVSDKRLVQAIALAIPLFLLGFTVFCHRDDPVYHHFLALFASRVGEPLSVLLLATLVFFSYAIWRQVSFAPEALTVALLLLAIIGPDTLETHQLVAPQWVPLLAAALVQGILGLDCRDSRRCLVGAGFLIAALLALPEELHAEFAVVPIAFHVGLFASLLIGALFQDALAVFQTRIATVLMVLACLAVLLEFPQSGANVPLPTLLLYPLVLAAILAGYGRVFRLRFPLAGAAVIWVSWLSLVGWRSYCWLREVVLGLDQLLLGLVLFGLAVVVSLAKSGVRLRWREGGWWLLWSWIRFSERP